MVPSPISGPAPFTPATAAQPPAGFEVGRDSSAMAVSPPAESRDSDASPDTGADDQAALGDRTLSATLDAAMATQQQREAEQASDDEVRDAQQMIQQQIAQEGYAAAREAIGLPGQSSAE